VPVDVITHLEEKGEVSEGMLHRLAHYYGISPSHILVRQIWPAKEPEAVAYDRGEEAGQ